MKKSIQEEIQDQNKRGVFLVLTGPTGSGKDIVIEKLQEKLPNSIKITTITTRRMRDGESEAKPYHFISKEEFEAKIANHEFFEWVEFRGHLYGTPKSQIEIAINQDFDAILKIESKGVKNIKEKIKKMTDRSVFVFLATPHVNTLEERVKEDRERWNRDIAVWEIEQYEICDYLVLNEDGKLHETIEKIKGIIETKRAEIIR